MSTTIFPNKHTRDFTYQWLIDLGFKPTRVKAKHPDDPFASKGWEQPKGEIPPGAEGYTVPPLTAWKPINGIGALLGVKHGGGLIDIDLDCTAARVLAPLFLPATPAIFGRLSTPKSHWLYRLSDPEPLPHIAIKAPSKTPSKETLLELRGDPQDPEGGGMHTIMPGSVHKDTGEHTEWAGTPAAPLSIGRTALLEAFQELALATLIVTQDMYPEGSRHDRMKHLSGVLCSCGWTEERGVRFLTSISEHLGAEAIHLKWVKAPGGTWQRKAGKKKVSGIPEFKKELGEENAHLFEAFMQIASMLNPKKSASKVSAKDVNKAEVLRAALSSIGVSLRYDLFTRRAEVVHESGAVEALTSDGRSDLWGKLEDDAGVQFKQQFFDRRVGVEARRSSYNSLQDWLNGLEWDGESCIDLLFIKGLNAEDTPLNRALARCFMIAAAKRALSPGLIQVRAMPIIEGPQEMGKSTFFRKLAVNPAWFIDDLDLTGTTRSIIEKTRGKLLVEQGELANIKGKDVEKFKEAISRNADTDSLKYDPEANDFPRYFVCVGTHNPTGKAYLTDLSGNTRFQPVTVKGFSYEGQKAGDPPRCDFAWLEGNLDQLWAEAVHCAKAGESHSLPAGMHAAAAESVETRAEEDPWMGVIDDWLSARGFGSGTACQVRTSTLWQVLAVPVERQNNSTAGRLNSTMALLGFTRAPKTKPLWLKKEKRTARGFYRLGEDPLEPVSALPEVQEGDRQDAKAAAPAKSAAPDKSDARGFRVSPKGTVYRVEWGTRMLEGHREATPEEVAEAVRQDAGSNPEAPSLPEAGLMHPDAPDI